MQQRRVLAQQQQQQPIRATQRFLHFTASQAGSQALTPQSTQTQRSRQACQHSQAVQGSQGVQLQSIQGMQMSSSQDLLMDGSQMAQPHGRNAETHDIMLAQTIGAMHTHSSQGLPSSQLEQGNQAMPRLHLTQPSQDTFAWSEETQADPPLTVNAAKDVQAVHHCTAQRGLLESTRQPAADPSAIDKPAQIGNAAVAAAAGPAPPTSRLRMKMKSLAAAAAINNAAAGDYASAGNSRQQDISALPLSLPAPAADQDDHSGQHLSNLPDDLNKSRSTEQAAAVEAAAEAAKAAAAQVKQALEAATAAQDECKAMAASAPAAAATAGKEQQEARHIEALSKIAGIQGSCTTLSSAVATLQSSCDIQAAKVAAVESTCQTLLGLLHGLSAQTQQAVFAIQACQVQQPAVTVLRCLESATQTSPVRVMHEAVQAELSPMTTGLSPGGDQVLILLLVVCMHLAKASIPCQQISDVSGAVTTNVLTRSHRRCQKCLQHLHWLFAKCITQSFSCPFLRARHALESSPALQPDIE